MESKFNKWFNEFMNGNSAKMSRSLSKKDISLELDRLCDSEDSRVIFKNKSGIVEVVAIIKGQFMNKGESKDCVFIILED